MLQALISPEQLVKDVNARSLYASPFPYNVTLEELTAFFENYGKVSSCCMLARAPKAQLHCRFKSAL